jgi:hypothetical protein
MAASRVSLSSGAGGAWSIANTSSGAFGAVEPRLSAGCAAATGPDPPSMAGAEANGFGAFGPLGLGATGLPGPETALGGGNARVVPLLLDDWFDGSGAAPLGVRCHWRVLAEEFDEAAGGRSCGGWESGCETNGCETSGWETLGPSNAINTTAATAMLQTANSERVNGCCARLVLIVLPM